MERPTSGERNEYVLKLKAAGYEFARNEGSMQVFCRPAVESPGWAPREATMGASVIIGVCAAALVLCLPLRRRTSHEPEAQPKRALLALGAGLALLCSIAWPKLRLLQVAPVGTATLVLLALAFVSLTALALAVARGRTVPSPLFVITSLLLAAAGSLAHGVAIGDAISEIALDPDGFELSARAYFAAGGLLDGLGGAVFGCVAGACVLVIGLVSPARPKWPLALNLAALWALVLLLGHRSYALDAALSETHFADRAAYLSTKAVNERALGLLLGGALGAMVVIWLASATNRDALRRFPAQALAAGFGLLGLGAVLACTLDGARQLTSWFASTDAPIVRESKLKLDTRQLGRPDQAPHPESRR